MATNTLRVPFEAAAMPRLMAMPRLSKGTHLTAYQHSVSHHFVYLFTALLGKTQNFVEAGDSYLGTDSVKRNENATTFDVESHRTRA